MLIVGQQDQGTVKAYYDQKHVLDQKTYLEAKNQQGENLGFLRLIQSIAIILETLRQTTEQVESDNKECLVWHVVDLRVLLVCLEVDQVLMNYTNTSLKDWLSIWNEARSNGDDHRRHALNRSIR